MIDKILYNLDNILVKYPTSKLWILAFLSIIALFFGAILLSFNNEIFSASLWNTWTYLVDPGTHVELQKGYTRTVGIIITIIGMLIFALLIGLISEAINDKLNQLKNGKTKVYEENHFLILGWSDKIKSLTYQINLAINNSKSNIVILSEKDKEDMEGYIANNINDLNMDIICRSGELDSEFYLNHVNIKKAKYVLLLANQNIDYSDEVNLKVILILLKKIKLLNIPITVEIQYDRNKDIFLELEKEHNNLNVVYTKDSLARLLSQSTIYQNLTNVYEVLFDYYDKSFNLFTNKLFYNKTLFEISKIIDNTSLCGIYSQKDKKLILDRNYIFQNEDKILTLLENKNIKFSKIDNFRKYDVVINHNKPQTLMIIGKNDILNTVLYELNISTKYNIIIASRNQVKLDNNYDNIKISLIQYNDISELIHYKIDKILIIPEDNFTTNIQKDSNVISNIMLLKKQFKNAIIVSEIFDPTTIDLLTKDTHNDYIVSNELVSKFLASVSYSNEINIIINDLLSSSGNIIKVVDNPIEDIIYLDLYYNLLDKNIILLGYIDDQVRLNPNNNTKLTDNDKIIIIQNDYNFS